MKGGHAKNISIKKINGENICDFQINETDSVETC